MADLEKSDPLVKLTVMSMKTETDEDENQKVVWKQYERPC
jgi:hypothetical protein